VLPFIRTLLIAFNRWSQLSSEGDKGWLSAKKTT